MRAQPPGCMHSKLNLTSAYDKLGCSYLEQNFLMFMPNEVSKLMLYVVIRARSNSRDAFNSPSLCGYYNIYDIAAQG